MISSELSSYLNSEIPKEKSEYFSDVISLTNQNGRKVAYHGSCTDGTISAALLTHLNEGDIFIPLNYEILKDLVLRPYLASVDWHAIIDLEPFNRFPIDLFVDHHRSVIGSKINSRRVHFESGQSGPSAAWVLFYSNPTNQFPSFLKQMVEISKITDTASYNITPPIESISNNQLDSILTDFDQICWLVQDALNIEDNYSLELNNYLVKTVAKGGIKTLINSVTLKRVNYHRKNRIQAVQFFDSIQVTDMIVITNAPNKTFKQTLALKLGLKKVKIIAFLAVQKDYVTISLRQSKLNTKNEIEYYRLDLLAKEFNPDGGGHAEAAGSVTTDLESAFQIFKEWARKKRLKMKIVNYED